MSQITFEETENMSNQDFMSWVFENFGQLIWYTAKKYCWTEGLWEEIMQESLLRLLSCIPRLRKLSEQKQLAKACLGLPDEVYYLLTSYYILGYRTEEMAEELGCPPKHVRMKMTRARRQVRKLIQEQNKEGIL